ncbi:MAG: 30S ribosomal protein S8 [Firmicutes bacterium]|nr:30S ribosomal protein S8 [Candidatus Fermentithermobacillaceae bacterium]
MMVDPIGDMLTRLRNAGMARHDSVEFPNSKLKAAIVDVLKKQGFIRDYEIRRDGPKSYIRVYLKYGPSKRPAITGIRQISKPGLRIYAKKEELPRVLGGLGIAIISTSKGVMTDKDARALGLGGEVICYVW